MVIRSQVVVGLSLLVFLCLLFSSKARVLSKDDVLKIQVDIVNAFKLRPAYGKLCNNKNKLCNIGNTIAALVRLAFHDVAAGNHIPYAEPCHILPIKIIFYA